MKALGGRRRAQIRKDGTDSASRQLREAARFPSEHRHPSSWSILIYQPGRHWVSSETLPPACPPPTWRQRGRSRLALCAGAIEWSGYRVVWQKHTSYRKGCESVPIAFTLSFTPQFSFKPILFPPVPTPAIQTFIG